MTMVNDLQFRLSENLIKAIYRKAYKLDADTIVINKAKYNWADIALFEGENCIDWHISISA